MAETVGRPARGQCATGERCGNVAVFSSDNTPEAFSALVASCASSNPSLTFGAAALGLPRYCRGGEAVFMGRGRSPDLPSTRWRSPSGAFRRGRHRHAPCVILRLRATCRRTPNRIHQQSRERVRRRLVIAVTAPLYRGSSGGGGAATWKSGRAHLPRPDDSASRRSRPTRGGGAHYY
jgi:hypothetical protein